MLDRFLYGAEGWFWLDMLVLINRNPYFFNDPSDVLTQNLGSKDDGSREQSTPWLV